MREVGAITEIMSLFVHAYVSISNCERTTGSSRLLLNAGLVSILGLGRRVLHFVFLMHKDQSHGSSSF